MAIESPGSRIATWKSSWHGVAIGITDAPHALLARVDIPGAGPDCSTQSTRTSSLPIYSPRLAVASLSSSNSFSNSSQSLGSIRKKWAFSRRSKVRMPFPGVVRSTMTCGTPAVTRAQRRLWTIALMSLPSMSRASQPKARFLPYDRMIR